MGVHISLQIKLKNWIILRFKVRVKYWDRVCVSISFVLDLGFRLELQLGFGLEFGLWF